MEILSSKIPHRDFGNLFCPQFNQQPGSPAFYPLRMSVGMKGEQVGDCSRATQRTAFGVRGWMSQ
jgi:hypothetical protein